MAARITTEPDADELDLPSPERATIADRLAAFKMLDSMPEATTLAQKSVRLSLCGFSREEIARMLGITPAGVSQNIYMARKKSGTAAKKAAATAKKATRRRS